jgi:hypothetical protein
MKPSIVCGTLISLSTLVWAGAANAQTLMSCDPASYINPCFWEQFCQGSNPVPCPDGSPGGVEYESTVTAASGTPVYLPWPFQWYFLGCDDETYASYAPPPTYDYSQCGCPSDAECQEDYGQDYVCVDGSCVIDSSACSADMQEICSSACGAQDLDCDIDTCSCM